MDFYNLNLEFRKVPSMFFLYEVNGNGTVVRNVQSKRHLKIIVDYHHSPAGYCMTFVNIKGKVRRISIAKIVAECWLGPKPEGYEIDHINRNSQDNHYTNLRYVTHSEQMKNRVLSQETIDRVKYNCSLYRESISIPVNIDGIPFPSIAAGARFIANTFGIPFENVRSRLKQKRKSVYGLDVQYFRNAETRHDDHIEEYGKE